MIFFIDLMEKVLIIKLRDESGKLPYYVLDKGAGERAGRGVEF